MMAASVVDETPLVSITNAWAEEGGTMTFTVSVENLSPTATCGFEICWDLYDGTAHGGGDDYSGDNGHYSFTPGGDTYTTFTVVIETDQEDEPDEVFLVGLRDPYTVGISFANQTAYGLIAGTTTAGPSLFVQDAAGWESGGTIDFHVLLGHTVGEATEVTIGTIDGWFDPEHPEDPGHPASAGSDYTAAGGILTIAAGASEGSMSIQLINDLADEEDEDFAFSALLGTETPSGWVCTQSATAKGTIFDDDGPTDVLDHMRLTEVDFTASLEITRDPDAQGTATAYTGSEWLDANHDGDATDAGDQKYPVAYKQGSTLQGVATFKLDAPWSGGTLLVTAVCTGNILVDWTEATIAEDGMTVTVEFEAADGYDFPTVVTYCDEFAMTWFAVVDGEEGSPKNVGTSSNDLYLTYDTPAAALGPLYETVLHLGTVAADGESTEAGVIQAVWDNVFDNDTMFDGNSVDTVGGMPLYYYKDYATAHETTVGLLTPVTVGQETFGDGTCVSWANFMQDVLLAQGIEQAGSLVYVKANYQFAPLAEHKQEGFLVDSWQFGQAQSSAAIVAIPGLSGAQLQVLKNRYKYLNVLTGASLQASYNANRDRYVFRTPDVIDGAGISGKGPNDFPASIFGAHVFTQYTVGDTTTWFDPSYGCCYVGATPAERLADLESDAIAGYYVEAHVIIDETQLGFDADGDGLANNIMAVATVLLIRSDPAGADMVTYDPDPDD